MLHFDHFYAVCCFYICDGKTGCIFNLFQRLQGATIKTDEETGKIVIARVMHGGAADRSGLIHVGDEVCEVNGINVEGKTPNDVLKILVSFYSSDAFSHFTVLV